MHSRFRKWGAALSVCTTLAFVATLVLAVPASAAPPTAASNFNPQNTLVGVGGITRLVLSDKVDGAVEEDGNDQTEAHITSVGSNDTTQAIYFNCAPGFTQAPGAAFPPPTGPAGCDEIGRDTAGEPAPGGDTAFEFFWDIPNTSDVEGDRNFLSFHCRGNPTGAEPASGAVGNCLAENEPNVYVDDAQTGATTSAGAIYEWCYDAGFDIDCDSERRPFGHPEVLPSPDTGDAILVFARFSSDVLSGQICVDTTADAANPPNACTGIGTGPVAAAGAFGELAVSFSAPLFPPGAEVAFFINDVTGGSGGCATDAVRCLLDTHYAVAEAFERPEQTHLHNDEELSTAGSPGSPGPPPVAPVPPANEGDDPDTFCEDSDRDKTGTVATGGATELIGCFFSQFGQIEGGDQGQKDPGFSLDLPATFVAPDGWSFDEGAADTIDCDDAGGTADDHDGDGDFEHCHFTGSNTNTNGTETYAVSVTNTGAVQSSTMLFCHDPEQGTSPAVNPDHGCGDASAGEQDSVSKNGAADHDHTHAVFTEDITPQCHTGAVSKSKPAASNVSVTGCVQDEFHNGAAGVRVIWRIISGPGQFVSVEQTTNANGQATAVITAPGSAEGQVTTVEFCSDVNVNGICDSSDLGTLFACPACRSTVQITWTERAAPPPPPPNGGRTTIRGVDICNKNRPTANLPELLIGDNGPDKICGFGGRDTLRGLGGKDDLRGGKGKDVHSGGKGQDNERGGKGADSLRGGKHADTLKGGPGRDTARGGPDNDLCRAEIERGCEQ